MHIEKNIFLEVEVKSIINEEKVHKMKVINANKRDVFNKQLQICRAVCLKAVEYIIK